MWALNIMFQPLLFRINKICCGKLCNKLLRQDLHKSNGATKARTLICIHVYTVYAICV